MRGKKMRNFFLMTIAALGLTQLVMSITMYVRHAPLTESSRTASTAVAPTNAEQASIQPQSTEKAAATRSESTATTGSEPKKLSADLDERARLDISTEKRDPFVPYYSLNKSQSPNPNAPLTAFDLSDLRVAAIIKDSAGSHSASIETNSGKSFIVKRGIQIGTRGGQIVDITSSKVIVSEILKDTSGKRKVRFYEMTLRSTKPPEGMTAER